MDPPYLLSTSTQLTICCLVLQLDLLKLDEDSRYSQPAATPPVLSAAATTTGLLATDPWADFQQPKKSFYSSSESDSGECVP